MENQWCKTMRMVAQLDFGFVIYNYRYSLHSPPSLSCSNVQPWRTIGARPCGWLHNWILDLSSIIIDILCIAPPPLSCSNAAMENQWSKTMCIVTQLDFGFVFYNYKYSLHSPPSLSCSNAAMENQWCNTMRMVAQLDFGFVIYNYRYSLYNPPSLSCSNVQP